MTQLNYSYDDIHKDEHKIGLSVHNYHENQTKIPHWSGRLPS